MPRTRLALASLLALAVGCTPHLVSSTGPQDIRTADESRIHGSFVGAGTRFTVRMDQPLDSAGSERGARFTAEVTQPLADRAGTVVVPAGARIAGQVTSMRGSSGPRLRLRFETVATTAGDAPLDVRVEQDAARTYEGSLNHPPGPSGYQQGPHGTYERHWGGGPAGYYHETYLPQEVNLPAGATLELVLTRPLLPPGSHIER
jgi:hypothetical protein